MQALFARMEDPRCSATTGAGGSCCQLHLALFTERVADRQLASIMPTNALRNAAMLAVRTPLAAMMDADLGVNHQFNRLVTDPAWMQNVMSQATDSPSLCILPAWEAHPSFELERARNLTQKALAAATPSCHA
ncbi:hypothetical protein GPECTOR_2g1350 [Gonium pectorale]|uniref:Uncharacterized protein n=1 Tax=Gonium pectorale TaxID=33097 RepID=A0A150H2I1_GONPE|nr:hypothetical protein GPECTOR_2g1350 [Gonium pectorale]|eukprot:KXZ55800.1 hypothetical protein GPECTOR_2g1350 [Gonium pectorale]